MPEVIGIGGWVLLAVAAIVICGGALLLRNRLGKPDQNEGDEEGLVTGKGRLQILESAQVDSARRLVLVRCDNIEHLIMVGGAADLVVQHDVGHSRVLKPVAKSTDASPGRRVEAQRREPASVPEPDLTKVEAAPAEKREPQQPQTQAKDLLSDNPDETKQIEPKRPTPQSDAPARAPRPNLAAVPAPVQQPSGKNGQAVGATSPANPAEARPTKQRPQPSEQPFARREPPAIAQSRPRPGHLPPVPGTTAPVAEMSQRVQPTALREGTVQADASDMEADIVRALHTDQVSAAPEQAQKPARAPIVAAKPATDPTTTLGDLAERLEEALAREVQSAHQGRARLDLDLDAFELEAGTAASGDEPFDARAPSSRPPERRVPETKAAPRGMTVSPEPDVRREPRGQSERQDEAPVISLNARRREAIDPLEDEMARLLGELTGDTTRR